jgi:hypothetical protein
MFNSYERKIMYFIGDESFLYWFVHENYFVDVQIRNFEGMYILILSKDDVI